MDALEVGEMHALKTRRTASAWLAVCTVCLTLCCGGLAHAYSTTLDPVADTWLDDDHHSANYGTSFYLEVRADSSGPDASALVKFDISSLPPNAVIGSASLQLDYCTRTGWDSQDWIYIGAYAVEPDTNWPRPWLENQATWDNYDATHIWDTEGCESIWYDREPNYDDRIYIDYNTAFGYKSWNVTSRVQSWYNGTDVNRGWLLRQESHNDPEGVTFYSREYSSGYRPKLVINYTVPIQPDPMTWQSQPAAVSTSSITMNATTATPSGCTYYFTATGGGHSNGWTLNTLYADTGLATNTKCGYRVKARDNDVPQHTTADSVLVERYTLIDAPTGVHSSSPTATTVALSASGSFPNLDQDQTGAQFSTTDGSWVGSWRVHATTDTATGLTPNTIYSFKARARNGDGAATGWCLGSPPIRTLAAQPTVAVYKTSCQGVQANWGANGNPSDVLYYCEEISSGKNSGWISTTSWILTGLNTFTSYHFRVKAKNTDGVETGWTDLGPVTTKMSIGYIKNNAPPATIPFEEKVVTASFNAGRLFFIQDRKGFGSIEGISGIAVRNYPGGPILFPGQVINMQGFVEKNEEPYSNELVAVAVQIHPVVVPTETPIVFATSGKSSGGGVFGLQMGVVDDVTQSPPARSHGISAVGMLMRVCGRFNDGGLGGVGYFWVDDGSGLVDEATPGIRVNLAPLGGNYPQPFPQYVAVTGIMRCVNLSGSNIRELWPLAIDVVLE